MNLTRVRALHRAKVVKTWAAAQEKAANADIAEEQEKLIAEMVDDGQSSSGKLDMPHEDEVLAAYLAEQLASVQSRIERAGPRVEVKQFHIHGQLWAGPKEDAKAYLIEALRLMDRPDLITLNYQSLSAEVREVVEAAGIDPFSDEIDISAAAPGWGQYVEVSRKTQLNMTKG